jgi:integrase
MNQTKTISKKELLWSYDKYLEIFNLKEYKHFLFFKWLSDEENILNTLNKKETIDKYILYLIENKTYNRANTLFHSLKHLYGYCYRRNFLLKEVYDYINRMKNLPIKEFAKQDRYITTKELDRIIKDASLWFHYKNPYKLKLILYFLLFTGIKTSELFSLKRENFNLEDNSVLIGKDSSEERIGYYPEELKDLIVKYFNSEREGRNAFNYSNNFQGNLLNILNKYRGRREPINFQLFRDSFISMMIKKTKNIWIAKKLLGIKEKGEIKRFEIMIPQSKIAKIYKTKIKINT